MVKRKKKVEIEVTEIMGVTLTPEQIEKVERLEDPRYIEERRALAKEIQKRVRHTLFHDMGLSVDCACIVDNSTTAAIICGSMMRMLADLVVHQHLCAGMPTDESAKATAEILHDLFCGKMIAYLSEQLDEYAALEAQLKLNRESHG